MTANSIPFLSNRLRVNRGTLFGVLILAALVAFEVFNYSTTDFALSDLLGELRFWGTRWATILAIAFCGIDFAGIARLFTPEGTKGGLTASVDGPKEVWYLFSAWLLAATMNAMLTWWGVSIAIINHDSLGNVVVARQTLLKVVPVFVAIMVWLIRVLIIGTFSVAGGRLFSQDEMKLNSFARRRKAVTNQNTPPIGQRRSPLPSKPRRSFSPTPKPSSGHSQPEPTYEPVAARRNSSQSSVLFS